MPDDVPVLRTYSIEEATETLFRSGLAPSRGWLRGAWAGYDKDGDGKLDTAELDRMLAFLREKFTPLDFEAGFDQVTCLRHARHTTQSFTGVHMLCNSCIQTDAMYSTVDQFSERA